MDEKINRVMFFAIMDLRLGCYIFAVGRDRDELMRELTEKYPWLDQRSAYLPRFGEIPNRLAPYAKLGWRLVNQGKCRVYVIGSEHES